MKIILVLLLSSLSLTVFSAETTHKLQCEFIACTDSENFDQVVKENSSQPIIYNVGMAGITFDTNIDESKKLLAQPLNGPNADGGTIYNEQIYVQWKLEDDGKPLFMLAFPGYQGKVQIQKPVGDIQDDFNLNKDFSSYRDSASIEDADRFAIDLYKALTASEDNCLEQKICSVDWGDDSREYFLVTTPGMILRLHKNSFITLVVLIRKVL
jgi:hypothetical protein